MELQNDISYTHPKCLLYLSRRKKETLFSVKRNYVYIALFTLKWCIANFTSCCYLKPLGTVRHFTLYFRFILKNSGHFPLKWLKLPNEWMKRVVLLCRICIHKCKMCTLHYIIKRRRASWIEKFTTEKREKMKRDERNMSLDRVTLSYFDSELQFNV